MTLPSCGAPPCPSLHGLCSPLLHRTTRFYAICCTSASAAAEHCQFLTNRTVAMPLPHSILFAMTGSDVARTLVQHASFQPRGSSGCAHNRQPRSQGLISQSEGQLGEQAHLQQLSGKILSGCGQRSPTSPPSCGRAPRLLSCVPSPAHLSDCPCRLYDSSGSKQVCRMLMSQNGGAAA